MGKALIIIAVQQRMIQLCVGAAAASQGASIERGVSPAPPHVATATGAASSDTQDLLARALPGCCARRMACLVIPDS